MPDARFQTKKKVLAEYMVSDICTKIYHSSWQRGTGYKGGNQRGEANCWGIYLFSFLQMQVDIAPQKGWMPS
jgi:hypothetical protein